MSDDYSDEQLGEIVGLVEQWYELFFKSPEFLRLTEAQRRKAGAITEFFARYSYTHHAGV